MQNSTDQPCLWFRGILPSSLINIPPEEAPVTQSNITYVNPVGFEISSGTYYGDASGSDNTEYPDIRRVGCAFAKLTEQDELAFAAHFPLPGEIQTVARGELYALVELIKHAKPMSDIEFVTDNKGVNDKFNAGPKAASFSSNCDMFHELFQTVYEKAIRLQVRWMPSHLKPEDPRPDGVSLRDLKGNDAADHYAGEAASKVQVSLQVATDCKHYYKLTKQIQLRIATIIINLPNRVKYKTVRTPKEVAKTLEDRISQSRHTVVLEGSRYSCKVCLNSFLRNDPSFQHWLTSACVALPGCSKPSPIVNNMIHVGNQSIHHSHKLAIHRGLVYCKRCCVLHRKRRFVCNVHTKLNCS